MAFASHLDSSTRVSGHSSSQCFCERELERKLPSRNLRYDGIYQILTLIATTDSKYKLFLATLALSKLLPAHPYLLPFALQFYRSSPSPLHYFEDGTCLDEVLVFLLVHKMDLFH